MVFFLQQVQLTSSLTAHFRAQPRVLQHHHRRLEDLNLGVEVEGEEEEFHHQMVAEVVQVEQEELGVQVELAVVQECQMQVVVVELEVELAQLELGEQVVVLALEVVEVLAEPAVWWVLLLELIPEAEFVVVVQFVAVLVCDLHRLHYIVLLVVVADCLLEQDCSYCLLLQVHLPKKQLHRLQTENLIHKLDADRAIDGRSQWLYCI